MEEMHKFFRPELINRFDEVVIFEPLRFIHMKSIVKIQLKAVQKSMEDQDMGFVSTDAAIKEIVRSGFDPVFGARPLRRAIQRLIENPISSLIIEKKVQAGDQVVVDYDGQAFIFNVEKTVMIDRTKLATQAQKKYLCETCANRFETLIVPNATIICSKCAGTKVQEVFEEKKPEEPPQKPGLSPTEPATPPAQAMPVPEATGDMTGATQPAANP